MCVSGLGSEHDMFETGELALNSRSNPFACILVGEVRSSHGMANPGKQGTSSNKFHGSRNPENHQMTNLDRSTAHFCATTQLTHTASTLSLDTRAVSLGSWKGEAVFPITHPDDFGVNRHIVYHTSKHMCACVVVPCRSFVVWAHQWPHDRSAKQKLPQAECTPSVPDDEVWCWTRSMSLCFHRFPPQRVSKSSRAANQHRC